VWEALITFKKTSRFPGGQDYSNIPPRFGLPCQNQPGENAGVSRNNVFASASSALLFGALFLFMADAGRAYDQEQFQAEDARLNQTYGALRQGLNESARSLLKTVQRSWVAFKEKDFAIFSSLARIARDPERIDLYKIEETESRTEALMSLGKSQPEEESEVKTAREADQMLNNIYRECIRLLPSDKVQASKETQALWIEFRDLHCRLDAAFRHGQVDDSVLRDLTMRRVIEFRHYMTVLLETQLPTPEENNSARDDSDEATSGPPPADPFRFAR
jgi:uncharacterized protein YecT (DUF1311 family)